MTNIPIYIKSNLKKPIDPKSPAHTLTLSGTYIDLGVENNDKDPKFKVSNRVRISKYKNIFVKSYTLNWSEEVFVIKEVKNAVPWINK